MKKILSILNVQTEDEAVDAITMFNTSLTDLRVATGQATASGAFQAATTNATAMRQIEALTGKSGGDAVAIVTAWKAGSDEAVTAKAKVAEIEKSNADAAAKASIDEACNSGQVQPSQREHFETLYREFGPKALSTGLAAMGPKAPGAPNTGAPPAPPVNNAPTTLTAEDREVARQMGVSNEQMLKFKADEKSASTAA